MLSTPVALFIFRRPHLTAKVFARIQQAQPRQLFIFADGPRHAAEAELCQQTRAIVDCIDWPCELYRAYREHNLGSCLSISSGLNRVFAEVETAIILEDDCLPNPTFFPYCQALLDYYQHDRRIMHISGNNFQPHRLAVPESYFFSKYVHSWGWATWRRAWQYFDLSCSQWKCLKQSPLVESLFDSPYEQTYWSSVFDQISAQQINGWDYAWQLACWLQSGLALYPTVNLVANLGFAADGTHTQNPQSPLANLPTGEITTIVHPRTMIRDRAADLYTFDHVFPGRWLRQQDTPLGKLRQRLSPLKQTLQRHFFSA